MRGGFTASRCGQPVCDGGFLLSWPSDFLSLSSESCKTSRVRWTTYCTRVPLIFLNYFFHQVFIGNLFFAFSFHLFLFFLPRGYTTTLFLKFFFKVKSFEMKRELLVSTRHFTRLPQGWCGLLTEVSCHLYKSTSLFQGRGIRTRGETISWMK